MIEYVLFSQTNLYYLSALFCVLLAMLYLPALLNLKFGVRWKVVKIAGFFSAGVVIAVEVTRYLLAAKSFTLLITLEVVEFCALAFFFGMLWPRLSVNKEE